MPRKCAKFISEYLIPSLNDRRFGDHLKWIDRGKFIFQLDWYHKGRPNWTEGEAEVFVEWDRLKGHYNPKDKHYYTKSKQRFRALLYKLTKDGQMRKLKSDDKYKKIYCIGEKKLKKKSRNLIIIDSVYEISNEDEICEEIGDDDVHTEEMCSKEVSADDNIISELEDHTYSSLNILLNTHSDEEDHTVQNFDDILLYDAYENSEKRVLMERNYDAYLNIPVLKDVNMSSEILDSILMDEDLQTETKSTTSTKTSGKLQNNLDDFMLLNFMKQFDENKIPTGTVGLNLNSFPQNAEYDSSYFDEFAVESSPEEFTSTFLRTMQ